MSNAMIGYGADIGIGAGSPVVYTSLGEVFEITPPEKTRGTVDVTHYQSPDSFREFLPTLKEGGDWGFGLHYIPAVSDALETAFDAGGVVPFEVTAPNGIRIHFEGIITSLGSAMPLDDKLTRSVTIKVSGGETRLAAV